MGSLTIDNVRKRYGRTEVLKGIDIDVTDGEFIILVGPSGCGKSTLLSMIAGLETISEGEVRIDGQRVNERGPKDRDIAMVFQSYALYPNMNVRQNIEFGLEMRGVPKDERRRIVERVAETLQMGNLLERRPGQLSGGQRQRVAMGRAMAREPAVFLFDEPLSNLDAKLRVEMRTEIKELHRRTGTTTVYVTHDQIEAMTLGDRIAVMKDGEIQQLGTPQEVYDEPANRFVAGFMGSPSMNFIRCRLEGEGDGVTAVAEANTGPLRLPLPAGRCDGLTGRIGDEIILGLRPEQITAQGDADGAREDVHVASCEVELTEPTGPDTLLFFHINGERVVGRTRPEHAPGPGQTLPLAFNLSRAVVFCPNTAERLA